MNKEIIDKWLENEYGVSYTRLEELHDFVIEQDLKHQEEKDKQIDQLTNNWNELRKRIKEYLEECENSDDEWLDGKCDMARDILCDMKEIKENNDDNNKNDEKQ